MNKALDLLNCWKDNTEYGIVYIPYFVVKEVEQALIKAQKQEKILNIILKKQVDIEFLKSADTVDEYNTLIETTGFLSDPVMQEEFELLKEMLK